jgi:alkaline phosphatase D
MMKNLFFLVILLATLYSCKSDNPSLDKEKNRVYEDTSLITTIAFGSCNKQWEDQAYWKIIGNDHPDLWIWMGDIIYSDTEDMQQLRKQYELQKGHQEYLSFADSCRIIGVWDDHDYGVNDGGNTYPKRKESRDLLFDFLDLDDNHPAWKREGAYQSYVLGPTGKQIKVFLLDGRYFKDPLLPDKKTEQRYLPSNKGTYLGETQWKWLEEEMKNSQAQVNLIVSGVQVIPEEHFFEKWANFPNERQRLFDLIKAADLQHPVFLSGDRHIAEFSKLQIDSTLILYEATSSGLTHSYEKADEENAYRIGKLIVVKNYGLIHLDWSGEEIGIEIDIKSIQGEILETLSM